MAYSKLHSSLVNSSLWCERDDVRILFITMLALADRDGYVWGSRAGIYRQANLSEDISRKNPFDILMEPDFDSSDLLRNPANEGRRIEEVEGGFHIVNYEYYRGLRNDDDRKIQNREAQRRHRKKISQSKPASATVSQRKQSPSVSDSASVSESKEKNSTESVPKHLEDVFIYGREIGLPKSEAEKFHDHFSSNGWKVGGKAPMRDWKASMRNWARNKNGRLMPKEVKKQSTGEARWI